MSMIQAITSKQEEMQQKIEQLQQEKRRESRKVKAKWVSYTKLANGKPINSGLYSDTENTFFPYRQIANWLHTAGICGSACDGG